MPSSAGISCCRIDLVPSRAAALAWAAWLLLALIALLASTLAWPLTLIGAGGLAMVGTVTLPRYVLLAGPRGLRAIEWGEGARTGFQVWLGPEGRRLPARPAGCRRYGPRLWLLRFRSSEGLVGAFVDVARQDPQAARHLAWRLFGPSADAGPPREPGT